MTWRRYHDGKTLGTLGTDGGIIILDEEHPEGARLTVEQESRTAPYSITCGIYGWFVHTRLITSCDVVEKALVPMKNSLEAILAMIPRNAENLTKDDFDLVDDGIAKFIALFP